MPDANEKALGVPLTVNVAAFAASPERIARREERHHPMGEQFAPVK